MDLTIDISSDLESRLLQEAARQGMDPHEFIVNAIRDRVQASGSATPHLDVEESRLLEEINQGLAETQWKRYYELVELRRQGTLGSKEFAELTALSNQIEELNARRMARLTELARLRGTALPALMEQLGIVAPPVM